MVIYFVFCSICTIFRTPNSDINYSTSIMNEIEAIQNKIYEIRGQRVMLDRDLAELYQVTTGNLNKAVKRNIRRFPPDFMFQLTKEEFDFLKQTLIFQNGISSWGGTRMQLDAISTALAELQSKEPKPRKKIGFIQEE